MPQALHEVVGAILVQDRQVLLGLRSPSRVLCPDVWDVFGGHREAGESPEACLIRELQEELGITPTHWHPLEAITDTEPTGAVIACQFYLVLAWTGTPHNQQPAEHVRIAWWSWDEAVRQPLAHPAYPTLFRHALAVAAANTSN